MALLYFNNLIIFGDFGNLKMEAVRGQIYKEMRVGVREPLKVRRLARLNWQGTFKKTEWTIMVTNRG